MLPSPTVRGIGIWNIPLRWLKIRQFSYLCVRASCSRAKASRLAVALVGSMFPFWVSILFLQLMEPLFSEEINSQQLVPQAEHLPGDDTYSVVSRDESLEEVMQMQIRGPSTPKGPWAPLDQMGLRMNILVEDHDGFKQTL